MTNLGRKEISILAIANDAGGAHQLFHLVKKYKQRIIVATGPAKKIAGELNFKYLESVNEIEATNIDEVWIA